MNMTMKERGKEIESKMVRGSKTVGRDVKKGIGRAGRKLESGAKTAGRDVKSAGRRMGRATRRELTRADARIRPNHRGKLSAR
jgi:hypothetical protein